MLVLATTGRGTAAQGTSPIAVDTGAMDAHLRFLASDLLEGRAPATRGGRLATEYIATQFQALGLQPAGVNGTYFQPVNLVGMTPQPTFAWGGAKAAVLQKRWRTLPILWPGPSALKPI